MQNCAEYPRRPHKGPFASREAGLHRTQSLRHGRPASRGKDGDRPLTDVQVKAYLAATDGDTDYGDMLKVILFTGLREAETLGLTWDCVDFERGTLKICKQLQKRPAEAGRFSIRLVEE